MQLVKMAVLIGFALASGAPAMAAEIFCSSWKEDGAKKIYFLKEDKSAVYFLSRGKRSAPVAVEKAAGPLSVEVRGLGPVAEFRYSLADSSVLVLRLPLDFEKTEGDGEGELQNAAGERLEYFPVCGAVLK
jgi:hypothetical protein